MSSELQCYRKGCTKTYLPDENKAGKLVSTFPLVSDSFIHSNQFFYCQGRRDGESTYPMKYYGVFH